MSRVKVADLEVTDRAVPWLVYVEPRQPGLWSDKEDKPRLLHISRRDGVKVHSPDFEELYNITNCNRALGGHAKIYIYSTLTIGGFSICPRCGQQADFGATLAEHQEWITARRRQIKEKHEREDQAKQQERDTTRQRLDAFVSEFLVELPLSKGDWGAVRVEYRDRLYEIKEVGEQ